MDWMSLKSDGIGMFKKYRYMLLVLLAGVFLMLLPTAQKEPAETVHTEQSLPSLQESLSEILSKIAGAGHVEVLLTESAGERTYYQTDEDISTGEHTSNVRRDTVLISDSAREKAGLVSQRVPPAYRGAIVLCQGADNAKVKLAIVEAVANATGLTTDKITVLKMK